MGEMDVTVEVLQKIRDELQLLRADTNERFGVVESCLLDLTGRRYQIARQARRISEGDGGLEARVIALESRVDKLESK
jgi:hypothetical protein